MARRNRNRRGIRPRDLVTAQAETNVRYGPERSTLNLMLGEAKGAFQQESRTAKQQARYSIKQAEKARAPLAQIYDRAVNKADVARSDIEQAFGEVGQAADPFEAATAREAGLNRQHVADAAARANKELTDRQQEARLGRQFALGAARQGYRSDVAKIVQQMNELSGREGDYLTARLDAKAKLNQTGRVTPKDRFNRQTQLDVAAAQQAGDEADGGKGKDTPWTPLQRREARVGIQKAVDMIQRLQSGLAVLPEGFYKRAVSDLVQYEDFDPTIARAATQLVAHGRVRPNTQAALWKEYGIGRKRVPKVPKSKLKPYAGGGFYMPEQ